MFGTILAAHEGSSGADAALDKAAARASLTGARLLLTVYQNHAMHAAAALLVPGEILDGVRAADHPQAQAVFLSCTALPALPRIAEIEARLDKPVLSSNRVLYWAILDTARIPGDRAGPAVPPVPVVT